MSKELYANKNGTGSIGHRHLSLHRSDSKDPTLTDNKQSASPKQRIVVNIVGGS